MIREPTARSEARLGGWTRAWPGLRFALSLAAFGLALFAFYRSPPLTALLAPLDVPTARLTAGLLGALGVAVERQGALLAHPGAFSYEIYYRCTGLIVAAFLAVGVAALPGARRTKLAGIALGGALILALNQVRLVSLFVVGVRWPRIFDFTHAVLWEGGMLLAVLLFWLWWLGWERAGPAGTRTMTDGR